MAFLTLDQAVWQAVYCWPFLGESSLAGLRLTESSSAARPCSIAGILTVVRNLPVSQLIDTQPCAFRLSPPVD